MTVQKDVTKNIYVGNGSTRTFPFTFECPAEHPEYIKVYLMQDDGTALATSDYQLDMDARQITYPSSGTALPEGKKLVIMRELPLQQMMNLVNNGPYFAEDVETAFDENVMAMQQIAEKLNRSIIMSVDIDGDAFVNEVPFEAGKSFRIADDGKSIVLTEDPGKVIDEAKGLLNETTIKAEKTATNAQEAKQAAAEIKTIYNSGGLTPVADLAGSIGTAIKRWGYIFANKVFAMNVPIVYKSVAKMKADSLLSAGMTACTLGYYSPNAGGAGTYIIRAKQASDVDDGGSLHELANGNVAELVVENGTVNVKQFGAKGDGVTDDTDIIKTAIAFINNSNNILVCPDSYLISETLDIKTNVTFLGNITYTGTGYCIRVKNQRDVCFTIKGILTSTDSGIICESDSALTKYHNTFNIGGIDAKNIGIAFVASQSGLQYCNVNLNGWIKGDKIAVKLEATQANTWVGEIKFYGGELRSNGGYGVYCSAVDNAEITGIRLLGTSLERCTMGSYFKNTRDTSYIAARYEQANSFKFVGKCAYMTFEGYLATVEKIDISELHVDTGTGSNISFNTGGLLSLESKIVTLEKIYIWGDGNIYIKPLPRVGFIADTLVGSSESPIDWLDTNTLLVPTVISLPNDCHFKLTKYHAMAGITEITLRTREKGNCTIYNSNNELIGVLSEPQSAYKIENIYDNKWSIRKL